MSELYSHADEAYDEKTAGRMTARFWRPVMRRGVISFPAPEDWRNVNEALHHVTGIWAAIDAAETVLPAEEGEG